MPNEGAPVRVVDAVGEDDPAIEIARPRLDRPGGAIASYAAWPRAGASGAGVVVVQHIWAVDAPIRHVVRRFAKAGYVAIAPDLFSRFGAPDGDDETDYTKFTPLLARLDDATVDDDMVAGATWIRERAGSAPSQRPPKVGINGYCMGGTIALRAAENDRAFDASAVWYGRIRKAPAEGQPPPETSRAVAKRIRIPILGSYGALDTGIPVEDVREFDASLAVPHDIKVYDDAGHAFFDETRSRYSESASFDAWPRTLAWFSKYLR